VIEASALTGFDPAARIADLSGETMGTYWSVRLAAGPDLDLPGLRAAIQARLDDLDAQMSHWSDA
jgi:thiamine biosynthesis lipoprotein